MCTPLGIVSFVFPRVSMFPSTSSRETLRLSGKQNSLFPSGAHIKCILFRKIQSVVSIFCRAQWIQATSKLLYLYITTGSIFCIFIPYPPNISMGRFRIKRIKTILRQIHDKFFTLDTVIYIKRTFLLFMVVKIKEQKMTPASCDLSCDLHLNFIRLSKFIWVFQPLNGGYSNLLRKQICIMRVFWD